jgi:hypothetical protein
MPVALLCYVMLPTNTLKKTVQVFPVGGISLILCLPIVQEYLCKFFFLLPILPKFTLFLFTLAFPVMYWVHVLYMYFLNT